jgi:hypothetical protein
MGKLSEIIKRAGRTEPAAMGFGAATRKPYASMLIVAVAGDHWPRAVSEAVEAGADALLLAGRPSDKDVEDAVAAAHDRACGLLAPDASPEQLAHLREAGVDFAIIGPTAPAAAVTEEKLSLAFQVRGELTDIQLRALDAMPFEAIYIDLEAAPATIMRLIELQRIAGLARKPLITHVAAESGQNDLVALRDSGVAMIAVDMKERNPTDALRKLRETIDSLPRRRVRREERASVALSYPSGRGEPEGDEEDDE